MLSLTTGIANLAVSVIQSFWLISYIQSYMGMAAYSYISVVIGLVNLTQVLTVAFTAVSSRYISVAMHEGNYEKACSLFNSIFFTLLSASILFIIIGFIADINIEKIMNIEPEYVNQVQVLFALITASLIINIVTTPFASGVFYRNKIYISNLLGIVIYLARISSSLLLYQMYEPQLWYAYLGSLIAEVCILVFYICKYRSWLPSVYISIRQYDFNVVKEILHTGIWVSISKCGSLMLSNISMYLSNLLFPAVLVGLYASASQFPSTVFMLTSTLVTCFTPLIYMLYAKSEMGDLRVLIRSASKTIGCVTAVLSGGIIVFGCDFLTLWLNQELHEYALLVTLMVVYLPVTYICEVYNQILIAYGETKWPAITLLATGIVNVLSILVLTNILHLGIYAIPISLMIARLPRTLIYFPMHIAHLTKIRMRYLFSDMSTTLVAMAFAVLAGCIVKQIIAPIDWALLIGDAVIVAIITIPIIYILGFSREEKTMVLRIRESN